MLQLHYCRYRTGYFVEIEMCSASLSLLCFGCCGFNSVKHFGRNWLLRESEMHGEIYVNDLQSCFLFV